MENTEKINVVFLDYDGVVNIPMWNAEGTRSSYGLDAVNSFQACLWVSEFCREYNFKIVVTATARSRKDYADMLYKGGLRKEVEVIDRTPRLPNAKRGNEIQAWLDKHPEVEKFLIFDDDSDMEHLMDHLVKTNSYAGFTLGSLEEAEALHNKLYLDPKDLEVF